MSQVATVFVVFTRSASAATLDVVRHAISEREPTATVEVAGGSLRTGHYGDTPITVSLAGSDWVKEEHQEMADGLSGVDDATRSLVRQADTRFEVSWNISADPDPVPETADLVQTIANELVRLTGGVALLGGSRLFDLESSATEQLFD